MKTLTTLEIYVDEESKQVDEDPSGKPYFETDLFFYLDGFRIDDMPSEEFKNYILTKLTEQL